MLIRKTTLIAVILILTGALSIIVGTISYAGGMEALEHALGIGPETTLTSLGAGFVAGLGCFAIGLSLTTRPGGRDH